MDIDLKKLFKKKTVFRKKSSEVDADFCWSIILYATAALVIAAGAFGWYLFYRVNKPLDPSAAATLGEAGRVRKDRIDSVLKVFEEREATTKKILNSPPPLVDPSF